MTIDDNDLREAHEMGERLGELQRLLTETDSFAEFLSDLVMLAKRSFPVEVHCSITLAPEGRIETAASSDDIATVADEAQYSVGSGPCLRSFATGAEVIVDDLTTDGRFGDYTEKAAALGLRSVVALPLYSHGDAAGALNLYAADAHVFADEMLFRARTIAAAAGGAVEIARRITAQARLNDDLQAAMASRRVIDQALGITMAKEGCDADRAFSLLRRASQNEHRKLRDVAAQIVTETGGKAPGTSAPFSPPRG